MGNVLGLQIIFVFILVSIGITVGFLASRELTNIGKNNSLDFVGLKKKHAREDQAKQDVEEKLLQKR